MQLFKGVNEYIGKINVIDTFKKSESKVDMCVILDASGSMGSNVVTIIQKILPSVMLKLGYDGTDKIHLITFDNNAEYVKVPINKLPSLSVKLGGATYMSGAITKLEQVLSNIDKVRILAISDGELHDQDNTMNLSSKLSQSVRNKITINSQAIRFFTSYAQPDTRGLSSILQFNNTTTAKLIDISSTAPNIIGNIVELFNDNLNTSVVLETDKKNIMLSPWATELNANISLNSGENIIWFKEKPTHILIGGDDIKITECSIDATNYGEIIGVKLEYYMNQIKILKVVNTKESLDELSKIMGYFINFEKYLESSDFESVKLLSEKNLINRVMFFKNMINKRKKSIIGKMAELANDDRIAKLNSAQQAEYLRSVDVSKNAKGLARRALSNDIDFNSVARKEVKAMHANLKEIIDIDDKSHNTSYYSLGTTLDGIKSLCKLVDENIIDDMDVNDILQICNFVGIACRGQIGDYPDAMTWRVDKLYSGCFVSMSDILTDYVSGTKNVKAPGMNDEITNVIICFDDDRIHKFIRKYASTLLEYTCSIGMRRLIADVPMTFAYSVCAGIWQLVEEIHKNPSQVNIETFQKLVNTYNIAIGSYFDHITFEDQDEKLSYYIGNNGITNLIGPLARNLNKISENNMKRVLRSMYSYEVYQAIRRIHKGTNGVKEKMLEKLSGIDEKHKTNVNELFVKENPTFHDNYYIDHVQLATLWKNMWYIDYLVLLPDYLKSVKMGVDVVKSIKELPKFDEKYICEKLGINYDLQTFKFFNIIQAVLHDCKKERVDDDKKIMKFIDLDDFKIVDIMAKKYVSDVYESIYKKDLADKLENEKKMLIEEYVESLLSSDIKEFIKLVKTGHQKGDSKIMMDNSNSDTYPVLREKILDSSLHVVDRSDKIKSLFTAKYDGEAFWNNGNILRGDYGVYKDFMETFNIRVWNEIREEYLRNKLHVYRNSENRHGHSNEKPSYWALGYESVEDMIRDLTPEQWNKYKVLHKDCCGVSKYMTHSVASI